MTADVENGIEVLDFLIGQFLRVLPECFLVFEEIGCDRITLESLNRALVDWGVAALWRSDHKLRLVLQNVPGMSKLRLNRNHGQNTSHLE